ncbi:hypothetical protein DITRI_Ditri18aG0012500 [Diplodiscus trichospermus]
MAENKCSLFGSEGKRMVKKCLSLLEKREPKVTMEWDRRPINVVRYNSNQLKIITEYGEYHFIAQTQFGKLYRGVIPNGWDWKGARRVTVKIWEGLQWGFPPPQEYVLNKKNKLMGHPNLAPLIGYCCDEEGIYAVVYDLDPRDTLHNFITKDSFCWSDRIKVALQLARLLAFLHSHELPYMVRNLDAMHIMIDENVNPVLFDFGMLTGGIIGEMKDKEEPNAYPLIGSIGYMDPYVASTASSHNLVISFVKPEPCIIRKRVVDKTHPESTVMTPSEDKEAYEKEKARCRKKAKACCWKEAECSIVNYYSQMDPLYDRHDGHVVTLLAICCMERQPKFRPKMKSVYERL